MAPKPSNSGKKQKNSNTSPTKDTKPSPSNGRDFIDTVDQFLTKRLNLIFYLSLGLAILFSILLFDVKVGPGGDDSAYIQRAFNFVHGFIFPGYQGPLYPMVLSPFILL